MITHQHIDHFGLASILARRSGAEVAALDRLAPFLASYGQQADLDDRFAERLMLRHGIPPDIVTALRAVSAGFRAWGSAVEVTRPLTDGAALQLRDRTLRVLHRPGHSPSDTVFLDEQRSILLAADHLITHISSNPLLARPLTTPTHGRYRSREPPPAGADHLHGLAGEDARDGPRRSCCPATGGRSPTTSALIDERFRLHRRRAEKIAPPDRRAAAHRP